MNDKAEDSIPMTIEDQVTAEKFGELLQSLMDVPGMKENAKALTDGSKVPIRCFDDPRYLGQERTMNLDSRMKPSVLRFISLCKALAGGFRAAYKPPVDFRLEKTYWLPACLELMSGNILHSEGNEWKTTLTYHDANLILHFFEKAHQEIIHWLEAIAQMEPLADVDEWTPFISTVYRVFNGKETFSLVLRENTDGNLVIEDQVFFALLRVCDHHDVAAKYAKGECPTECFGQLAVGNMGNEYDHTAICKDSSRLIRLTHDYLDKRYRLYLEAGDAAQRHAALCFDEAENRWADFLLREYCCPTEYHLARCDRKQVNVDVIKDWLLRMEAFSEILCDQIFVDSDKSPEARAMHDAFRGVRAEFRQRTLYGAMPSYARQKKFAQMLAAFMQKFNAAVLSVKKAKTPGVLELVEKKDGVLRLKKTMPTAQSVDGKGAALGEWVRKKVVHDVNFDRREITFLGNKKDKPPVPLACPPTSDGPWGYLVRMLTSKDPEGWVELAKDEARTYRQQFLRSGRKKNGEMRPGDIALRELYRHIECSNDIGRHDEVTKIRLVRRAKTMKETSATKPALQAQAATSGLRK